MPKAGKGNLLEKFIPVLLLVTVGLAFAVGFLWQKVMILEKGATVSDSKQAQAPATPDVNGKLSNDQAKNIPPVSNLDHIRGSKDAEVVLIEYADLECPFCKDFHATAKQAVEAYAGKLAWVYRDFPLDALHTKARSEAQAAECVATLAGNDAFWKYIDKIYEVTPSNNQLSPDLLPQIAGQLGVDKTKFNSCLSSQAAKDTVEADYQGGVSAGITGTPGSFIVNKKGEVWMLPGAVPLDTLKQTIDQALKS